MNISSLLTPSASSHYVPDSAAGSILHSFTPAPSASAVEAGLQPQPQSADDQRQAALQRLNKQVSQAYEKLSSSKSPELAAYSSIEPLSAEKVANNILGFIERRLTADAANGATQEQLQSRLDAGLAGFKKGFGEASEQLKALNLMSPEVEQDIGKTYKLVLDGIDGLRSKFIKDSAPAVNDTATKTPTATALVLPDAVKNAKAITATYAAQDYAEARNFHFELTTREGDKVVINAASSYGASVEAGTTSNGSFYKASESQAQSFSFSVEGDLNADELKSINDLLGKVNDLADQFYAGNLDQAFNNASALGYDDQQIAGYSLNLAQVQIQQVTEAYSAQQPDNNTSAPALSDELEPFGKFFKDLLAALDEAKISQDPQKLLLDMSRFVEQLNAKDDQQDQSVAPASESRLELFLQKSIKLSASFVE